MQNKIEKIKSKIQRSALQSHRNPSDITLLAVSKRHHISKIIDAIQYGILNFGENYAQELRDKSKLLEDKINWHFIGPIQQNKVKYIVGTAKLIHTVSTPKILNAIQKKAEQLNIIQEVLVQIKTGNEISKSGLPPEKALEFFQLFKSTPNVKCVGLMTIPPFNNDPEKTRPYFAEVKNLFDVLNDKYNLNLKHISMGMSSDFEVAIEEGATIVRIGTAIFGPRPTSLK